MDRKNKINDNKNNKYYTYKQIKIKRVAFIGKLTFHI